MSVEKCSNCTGMNQVKCNGIRANIRDKAGENLTDVFSVILDGDLSLLEKLFTGNFDEGKDIGGEFKKISCQHSAGKIALTVAEETAYGVLTAINNAEAQGIYS